MKKFYLIAFDISSDKIRRKIVKLLLSKATRVQKSVFEAILTDKEYLKLKEKIDKEIEHNNDSLRYYQLCKNCIDNLTITGQGTYTSEEDVIVV